MSMGHGYVLLGQLCILVLCPFLNWIFFLMFLNSSYISKIKPLPYMSLATMFSHKVSSLFILMMVSFFKIFYSFFFRERGRKGERGRNIYVRGKQLLAALMPPIGDLLATLACVLAGNPTSNPLVPLVCRPALNPLNYSIQGEWWFLSHADVF